MTDRAQGIRQRPYDAQYPGTFGDIGKYRVTWQAVVDGLKRTPRNPSFLIARDAILRASRA